MFLQAVYHVSRLSISKFHCNTILDISKKILDHSDAASVMQIDDSGGTAGAAEMNSIKENIEIRMNR